MELFKLTGKIAIEGVEHAKNSINNMVELVKIGSDKISDDLNMISNMMDRVFENKKTFKYSVERTNEKNTFGGDNIIDRSSEKNSAQNCLFDENSAKTSIDKIDKSVMEIFLKNRNNFYDFFSDISEKLGSLKSMIHIQNKNEINDTIKQLSDSCLSVNNIFENFSDLQNVGIGENTMSMKNVVSENIPQISAALLNGLEAIYHSSLEKWQKIGSAASAGTSGMAKAIQNGKYAVISACSSVADSALKNLMIDASSAGEHVINTFGSGIYNSAWCVYSAASDIANSVSQTLSSITASINIPIASVNSKLPAHAKGGIVTREHIARVGEDGAEAIIPLEKNTQWIDKVAERLNGSSASNNAVLEKLSELNDNIKNLKIYLDSGALVGEIAPKMDKKLGSIARIKRRGAAI